MVFGDTGTSEYNIIQHNYGDASGISLATGERERGILFSAYGQKAGNIFHNIWRYNIGCNASVVFLGMGSTGTQDPSINNTYYQNIGMNCKNAFELCQRTPCVQDNQLCRKNNPLFSALGDLPHAPWP